VLKDRVIQTVYVDLNQELAVRHQKQDSLTNNEPGISAKIDTLKIFHEV